LTAPAPAVTSWRMEEDPIADLSFEDALKRLEAIVQQLESGDVPLEQSIALYAEGDKLRAQCEARLKSAQARIDQIQIGSDGTPADLRPFDAQ
jgi:exodeoxyribonuclease VII small subunit